MSIISCLKTYLQANKQQKTKHVLSDISTVEAKDSLGEGASLLITYLRKNPNPFNKVDIPRDFKQFVKESTRHRKRHMASVLNTPSENSPTYKYVLLQG